MQGDAPEQDEREEENIKQLSAEEVKALREAGPVVSPWRVIGWQALIGLLVTLLVWGATGSRLSAWSSAYGAVCVVVPAMVFVRGMARQQFAPNVGVALGGFFVWEMVKVVLTIAMLFAAPNLVVGLNWLALLAGFVVTMKVYWVAMWLHSRHSKSIAKI